MRKASFSPRHLIAPIAAMLTAAVLVAPTPVSADTTQYFREHAKANDVPRVLSSADRTYYSALFQAIDRKDWGRVEAMLSQRASGPLHQIARAEYYLHPNSPRVELPRIQAWLAQGTALPQAQAMANLGRKRGLTSTPYIPQLRDLNPQSYITKRMRPRTVKDGSMPASTRSKILARIKADDPNGANALLYDVDSRLSSAARAEWRQRVAWSYYIENNDFAALSVALTVREGTGAWVAEGDWVAGLAAWRLGDCAQATDAFGRSAGLSTNPELSAAAHYWASRAHVRCREPERAAEQLRGAARYGETLYGMLAREQLGQAMVDEGRSADLSSRDWQTLKQSSNVQVAVALAEIGQTDRSSVVLRHESRIGNPANWAAMSRLARELGYPSTQLWMAYNAPAGGQADPAVRFPTPKWTPVTGWKVDPALAYAHALQESNFRASVVSPAGARGLMQIMPAAARDHARKIGVRGNARDLSQPEINLAFGQEHLAMLRDSRATQGKLPKIMAAYNAGLTPITRWNGEVRDQGDSLLYMESIPYWETRSYVAIVMRNYWMYEQQANAQSASRKALAQGQWPGFPGR